jgi:hypothetical protein
MQHNNILSSNMFIATGSKLETLSIHTNEKSENTVINWTVWSSEWCVIPGTLLLLSGQNINMVSVWRLIILVFAFLLFVEKNN